MITLLPVIWILWRKFENWSVLVKWWQLWWSNFSTHAVIVCKEHKRINVYCLIMQIFDCIGYLFNNRAKRSSSSSPSSAACGSSREDVRQWMQQVQNSAAEPPSSSSYSSAQVWLHCCLHVTISYLLVSAAIWHNITI